MEQVGSSSFCAWYCLGYFAKSLHWCRLVGCFISWTLFVPTFKLSCSPLSSSVLCLTLWFCINRHNSSSGIIWQWREIPFFVFFRESVWVVIFLVSWCCRDSWWWLQGFRFCCLTDIPFLAAFPAQSSVAARGCCCRTQPAGWDTLQPVCPGSGPWGEDFRTSSFVFWGFSVQIYWQ